MSASFFKCRLSQGNIAPLFVSLTWALPVLAKEKNAEELKISDTGVWLLLLMMVTILCAGVYVERYERRRGLIR